MRAISSSSSIKASRKSFHSPVVREPRRAFAAVRQWTFVGAYDALDFLQYEWPLRHGELYGRAIKTCCGALGGATPLVVSREAFVAACREAGMAEIIWPRKTTPQLHWRSVRPVHHA